MQYIDDEFDKEHELLFQINLILFKRNLVRFGCMEIVEGPGKYSWDKEIIKFRPTSLGLYVFNKALFENYL